MRQCSQDSSQPSRRRQRGRWPRTVVRTVLLLVICAATWCWLDWRAGRELGRALQTAKAAGLVLGVGGDVASDVQGDEAAGNDVALQRLASEAAARRAAKWHCATEDRLPILPGDSQVVLVQALSQEERDALEGFCTGNGELIDEAARLVASRPRLLPGEQGPALPLRARCALVELLGLGACDAAALKDAERVVRLTTCMRLVLEGTRSAEMGQSLQSELQLERRWLLAVAQCDASTQLDENQLTWLQTEISAKRSRRNLREVVCGALEDRFAWARVMQAQIIADARRVAGIVPVVYVLTPGRIKGDLAAVARLCAEDMQGAALDGLGARDWYHAREWSGVGETRLPRILSGVLVLSVEEQVDEYLKADATSAAVEALLACERFRLLNGVWPEELGDLVPELLVAVPSDPLTGSEIRFECRDGEIRLWCGARESTQPAEAHDGSGAPWDSASLVIHVARSASASP